MNSFRLSIPGRTRENMKQGNAFRFGSQRFKYFLIVAFGLVIIYFNLRAINQIPLVPEPRSVCGLDSAKYLIEDLVICAFIVKLL